MGFIVEEVLLVASRSREPWFGFVLPWDYTVADFILDNILIWILLSINWIVFIQASCFIHLSYTL
jgi:hypothetical protein